MLLTFKYRIKDSSAKRHLRKLAIACNQVWNYCAQIQRECQSRYVAGGKISWPTQFDLTGLTTGCSKELGIHSDTVGAICAQFVASRNRHKKCPKLRASFGPKKSLGWIPFSGRSIRIDGDCIRYLKRKFRFWKSRDMGGKVRYGAFVEDARDRWYVCFVAEAADALPTGEGTIGIDLGLKTLATCSDGTKIDAPKYYRKYEAQLAKAQRARNKRRVKAIHAKIANSRKHYLHEQTTKLAKENRLIVIGDVSSSKMVKTRMAKSVSDAGWAMLKAQLRYKASRHGAAFIIINENSTSQTCSHCGAISRNSPKGMGALGIRHWTCSECGTHHDRDINAAKNILRVGLERQALAGEALAA